MKFSFAKNNVCYNGMFLITVGQAVDNKEPFIEEYEVKI
jgi:hypothetical protein